jgi:hypothetical protein
LAEIKRQNHSARLGRRRGRRADKAQENNPTEDAHEDAADYDARDGDQKLLQGPAPDPNLGIYRKMIWPGPKRKNFYRLLIWIVAPDPKHRAPWHISRFRRCGMMAVGGRGSNVRLTRKICDRQR